MKLPLIILAGRDTKSASPHGDGKSLHGFKAVNTRVGGVTMLEALVTRLRTTGAFDPIAVAGPAAVYEPLGLDVLLVDTDSTFSGNLKAGLEALMASGPIDEMAVATSDVLPSAEDLATALDDYRAHRPLDFWMPQHRVQRPSELGSSGYKPRYYFKPTADTEPVATLPSHLVIGNPCVLRLRELLFLFDIAYATRERGVRYRRALMLRKILGLLLGGDLRRFLRGRAPLLTWDIVTNGVTTGGHLTRHDATAAQLEDLLRRFAVRRAHRRRLPDRRGRVALLSCRSLARDVDTEAEARELSEKGTL